MSPGTGIPPSSSMGSRSCPEPGSASLPPSSLSPSLSRRSPRPWSGVTRGHRALLMAAAGTRSLPLPHESLAAPVALAVPPAGWQGSCAGCWCILQGRHPWKEDAEPLPAAPAL